MNIGDPYVSILQRMQNQGKKYNPPPIEIGTVTSSDPLTIKVGDQPLTKDNILVADFLLSNYKRKISIPSTSATGTAEDKSISNIAIPDAELSFTDGLKKDDMVACLATSNEQTYILLCRVVKL
ncbi:DUF2577 domain-containing protein [Clostridium magnum]|uniref:DUF2577 domain-containing protein n=1 Tax=Clostridium magnum DSM 2767 TaxID=1121326 RepID=A0A162UX60_9CLOT|nr:DUF2577 domain-containing protein [Clostridium magnum]KZL94374.1 hypothetical protein CLMAG_14270 [Clostridium magnum DSM 2767]SHJ50157.1 Protein of unknown function [Clostridium magnum DSM 2767]